ncbi:MAG: hypothetical protein WBL40_01015 [Terrimicrobiaceae bacterium]
MRFSLAIATVVALGSCFATELLFHSNDYRGIKPGKSTLEDAIRILGNYREVVPTPNGYNYRFPTAIINIGGEDRVHINTIIIDGDTEYVCPKGLSLGDRVSKLVNRLTEAIHREGTSFDEITGIFYCTDEGSIRRIVLMYAVSAHLRRSA